MMHHADTLPDALRLQAKARGAVTALAFEGRRETFAELDARASQVANGLRAAGLAPGSRIAYLGKNSDRYFELLFGAAKAGVVPVPVNWRLAPPEIVYILNDSAARLLVVGPEFIDVVDRLRPELPLIDVYLTVEDAQPGWQPFASWRDRNDAADPLLPVASGDVALQLYTSGTTGRPKGAMLRHVGLTQKMARDMTAWQYWDASDVGLVAMPIFHIGGTGMGLRALTNGATAIVAREFNAEQALDSIANDRITKLFIVPAALQLLIRHPKARTIDTSCVKYVMYGAAPIPLDLLREAMGVFSSGFVQLYGMTETCGSIVALPPEDHTPEGSPVMRSAGKAMPGTEIEIRDENGKPVPSGTIGEIAIRSVSNMAGYWGLEEATRQTLGDDGWLLSGDAGYLDKDGYLFIQDRVKDMIISGGENVYPAEVENAIFGHPDVAEVAVIGVPDPKWGEAVKAIVVAKPGTLPSADDIIAFARTRIAAYKAPKSVDFIDTLPRNPTGKVLRRILREPYWKGRDRQVN